MDLFSQISTTYLILFFSFVLIATAIDHYALSRSDAPISLNKALIWSLVWVMAAFLFNAGFYYYWLNIQSLSADAAQTKAIEFFTAWSVEKMLSVDNLFVFLMLFALLKIPPAHQRSLLTVGVLVSIVLRSIMCFVGLWLIQSFSWLLYVFGVMLIALGAKMLYLYFKTNQNPSSKSGENKIVNFLSSFKAIDLQKNCYYYINSSSKLIIGSFGACLIAIFLTDALFALDSIPAILAITTDPYILITSNTLAVLGLRALYFVLKDMKQRFYTLEAGVGVILVFVGLKMLLSIFFHVPALLSLAIISLIIIGCIAYSTLRPQESREM